MFLFFKANWHGIVFILLGQVETAIEKLNPCKNSPQESQWISKREDHWPPLSLHSRNLCGFFFQTCRRKSLWLKQYSHNIQLWGLATHPTSSIVSCLRSNYLMNTSIPRQLQFILSPLLSHNEYPVPTKVHLVCWTLEFLLCWTLEFGITK